jgi:hypothetical protein
MMMMPFNCSCDSSKKKMIFGVPLPPPQWIPGCGGKQDRENAPDRPHVGANPRNLPGWRYVPRSCCHALAGWRSASIAAFYLMTSPLLGQRVAPDIKLSRFFGDRLVEDLSHRQRQIRFLFLFVMTQLPHCIHALSMQRAHRRAHFLSTSVRRTNLAMIKYNNVVLL